jgi:thioredoxin reductase
MSDFVFGETAKAMEVEDMKEIIEAFSYGAERVKQGGFDGIEIDMGPESLLRQFLSPISNHRSDEYGGSLENRMRFPLAVVETVRDTVGADFPLGVRLCGDEQFWGGITPEESIPFAKNMEATGKIDFLNVAVGTFYNLHLQMPSMHVPAGFALDTATAIAEAVNVPVIGSHHIDFPGMAEEVVKKGAIQGVGLVRSLRCDPDAPNKAKQGRTREICRCIRDNEGCIGRLSRARVLACTLNPDVGYEYAYPEVKRSGKRQKKKVLVVGAGPGGMEAARVAGEHGHRVTLFEKGDEIGGLVNLAKKCPGRGRLSDMIRFNQDGLEKCGVEIETGIEVSPKMVLNMEYDAIIIATGALAAKRPVDGEYGPPWVLTVPEVLQEGHTLGGRILYIDENGGHHATGTAEWLADQGKKVDMVTSELFIGMDLLPVGDLSLSQQRLLEKGVTFTCDIRIERIDVGRVTGRHVFTHEKVLFDDYDNVIIDMGYEAEDKLYRQLKGQIGALYRIGDCVAPRGIGMAVFEGRKVGEDL